MRRQTRKQQEKVSDRGIHPVIFAVILPLPPQQPQGTTNVPSKVDFDPQQVEVENEAQIGDKAERLEKRRERLWLRKPGMTVCRGEVGSQ